MNHRRSIQGENSVKWAVVIQFLTVLLQWSVQTSSYFSTSFSPGVSLKSKRCHHTIVMTRLQVRRIPILSERSDICVVGNRTILVIGCNIDNFLDRLSKYYFESISKQIPECSINFLEARPRTFLICQLERSSTTRPRAFSIEGWIWSDQLRFTLQCIYFLSYTHTHTHAHIYIYIYIERERESERERKRRSEREKAYVTRWVSERVLFRSGY